MSSIAFNNNPEDNPFADPFARGGSPDPWSQPQYQQEPDYGQSSATTTPPLSPRTPTTPKTPTLSHVRKESRDSTHAPPFAIEKEKEASPPVTPTPKSQPLPLQQSPPSPKPLPAQIPLPSADPTPVSTPPLEQTLPPRPAAPTPASHPPPPNQRPKIQTPLDIPQSLYLYGPSGAGGVVGTWSSSPASPPPLSRESGRESIRGLAIGGEVPQNQIQYQSPSKGKERERDDDDAPLRSSGSGGWRVAEPSVVHSRGWGDGREDVEDDNPTHIQTHTYAASDSDPQSPTANGHANGGNSMVRLTGSFSFELRLTRE